MRLGWSCLCCCIVFWCSHWLRSTFYNILSSFYTIDICSSYSEIYPRFSIFEPLNFNMLGFCVCGNYCILQWSLVSFISRFSDLVLRVATCMVGFLKAWCQFVGCSLKLFNVTVIPLSVWWSCHCCIFKFLVYHWNNQFLDNFIFLFHDLHLLTLNTTSPLMLHSSALCR